MSGVDHFFAELVPTVVMGVLAWAGFGVYGLVLFLAGVRWGRRDAFRAVGAMRAAFVRQLDETVPLLTGRDGGR